MTTPIGRSAPTADDILAQIAKLSEADGHDGRADARESYQQAAAVLAAVSDLHSLRPLDAALAVPDPGALLAADVIPVPSASLDGEVLLRHDVRRDALRALGTRQRMLEALEMNPAERSGTVQAQLERYIQGTAEPIERQSPGEREASLQALTWLEGIVPDLPSLDALRSAIARDEFTRPFEALAGDTVFRGRVGEMDKLRGYVGVLPPQGLLRRLLSKVPWPRPDAMPALSLYGPGGVGKSALVARFVLEHSRLQEDARIPFAYLDFDRPSLNVAEPATLLDEMLRQLTLQFPELTQIEELRTRFREALARDLAHADAMARQAATPPSDSSPPATPAQPILGAYAVTRATLADLLGLLETTLGPRPYLIVLDTFEQVQYRGETLASPLWSMLVEIQKARPFLRVVISGRAPATTLFLAGAPPVAMALGELDRESAIAYLQAQGIESVEIAEAVIRQVGGVPLSLKLAATVLKRTPRADLNVRSRSWLGTADEIVQGQLFGRILDQIEREDVRRMAHPGLVLRRITPAVIFNVLREPCLLPVANMSEAESLFAELRREVSLVTEDDGDAGDDALIHRRELRAVMLKLLLDKEPAKAKDIGQRAVAWYATQPGKRARAEESYHRLLLGDWVDKDMVTDPEVRSSIQASIAELPVESQRLLATYGYAIDPKILAQASVEDRDAALAAHVEELLPHASALADAAAALASRGAPEGDSPLWRASARVALESGDLLRALQVVEMGLIQAAAARNGFRTFQLLAQKAWTCELANEAAELEQTLPVLAEYAERQGSVTGQLQHWMQLQRARNAMDAKSITEAELAVVGRFLTAITPRDFFAVFAATRGFWHAAAEVTPGARTTFDFGMIARLIAHAESPFGTTSFESDRARFAIRSLLSVSYSLAAPMTVDVEQRYPLATALEEAVDAWPYRNLHVQPPESRRQGLR